MQMTTSSSGALLAAIGLVTMATLVQIQTATPISVPAILQSKETDVKFYPPFDDS